MEEVGIYADAGAPEAVCGRGQLGAFLRVCVVCVSRAGAFDVFLFVGGVRVREFLVAGEVHTDGADWVEALGADHVWDRGPVRILGGRVQDEHAEADEGVAEEDGGAENDHDEEDVDFLPEVFAGEGEGKVFGQIVSLLLAK